MPESWKPYAKAITAGVLAGLGALGTALADDRVSSLEVVAIATAVVAAAAGVWGIPNRADGRG